MHKPLMIFRLDIPRKIDDPDCARIAILRSNDPDDAFAWWAIETGRIGLPDCTLRVAAQSIEANNQACLRGEPDVAAISSAAWPLLAANYAILSAGASVGRGYGPALTAGKRTRRSDIERETVAIPGEHTTGALLLRIFFPGCKTVAMQFTEIAPAILRGEVAAGVLIHEELLNWRDKGLRRLLCLGAEWTRQSGLPLPVGLNVAHRRLGGEMLREISRLVRQSMLEAHFARAAAREFALRCSIQVRPGIADEFIGMFANRDTLELDADCLCALETLYRLAHERGLLDCKPELEIIASRTVGAQLACA